MSDKKTAIQAKASYFIIGTVMWEFFSYFGMQALLILYLSKQLHFPDSQAYAIYGSFSSITFLSPIIGGWLADKYCGYRYAVIWGCILMILGHLTLGAGETGLYFGLSFLILGIGLFKSNAICLIADCYANNQAAKNSAFVWYYVSGNLGAVISQIFCPYLAKSIGWHAGFMAAAFGMGLGLITLIASKKHFSWHQDTANSKWLNLHRSSQILISLLLLLFSLLAVYFILKELWVGKLLLLVSMMSMGTFYSIFQQANSEQKQPLIKLCILMAFATGFWIFDQQGTSSISLFISRYVERSIAHFTVPTGSFQAINPAIVLVFGSLTALFWKKWDNNGFKLSLAGKLSMAMLLLALGFLFIAEAANIARFHHTVAMTYPVLGLMLIGSAEIFVDPVLL
ncbi:MAG: ybgH, partial [Gammaproteobacteria bacterium]|nr:ybgH [Gammaproteobacteria bacterium]